MNSVPPIRRNFPLRPSSHLFLFPEKVLGRLRWPDNLAVETQFRDDTVRFPSAAFAPLLTCRWSALFSELCGKLYRPHRVCRIRRGMKMTGTTVTPPSTVHQSGAPLSLPFLVLISLVGIGAFKCLPHIVRYSSTVTSTRISGGRS
jgi:hypothetical protein